MLGFLLAQTARGVARMDRHVITFQMVLLPAAVLQVAIAKQVSCLVRRIRLCVAPRVIFAQAMELVRPLEAVVVVAVEELAVELVVEELVVAELAVAELVGVELVVVELVVEELVVEELLEALVTPLEDLVLPPACLKLPALQLQPSPLPHLPWEVLGVPRLLPSL